MLAIIGGTGLYDLAGLQIEQRIEGDRHEEPVSILKHLAILLGLASLGGCASPVFDVSRTETVLPLSRAWVDGRVVEYVTTDVSDAAMAQMTGANFVPRLRDAIASPGRPSILERVYKFSGNEQISVFQSAPLPAGSANADRSYSPLWRVTVVRWAKGAKVRELKSEEELLAAKDIGHVSLEPSDIVVNCPITRAADGRALRGVR